MKNSRVSGSILHVIRNRFFKSLMAIMLVLIMVAGYSAEIGTVKANTIKIDLNCIEEGMMRMYNMQDGEDELIPGLLYKKDDKSELYISLSTASQLSGLSLNGGGNEYRFFDDFTFSVVLKSNGDVTVDGKGAGSVDVFEYKDMLYADLEQILAVLGVQFSEENDKMVYLPRQKSIIDYLDKYLLQVKSTGVRQSELNIDDSGTYSTAFKASICLVLNHFDLRIFVPFINDDMYIKDEYEQALLQLAIDDREFYTEEMLEKIGTSIKPKESGSLVDIMNYASKANDLVQFTNSMYEWSDVAADLEKLQKTYKSTKFSKTFEADLKSIDNLDDLSYVFGMAMDVYSLFNVYAEASDIQTRSKAWTTDYYNQLKLLQNIGDNSYGDAGKMVKDVAGKLGKEYQFPDGAAVEKYADGLLMFALGKMADLTPIGPVITVTNAGIAIAQADPTIKSKMDSYENMYTVRMLIQVGSIAQSELDKRYNEIRVKILNGTVTQKDLDELRDNTYLVLRCALRNCALTYKLYEELAEQDWSGEAQDLQNRMNKAAELLARLENTDIWDYQLLTFISADDYYSDEFGEVRTEITENIWVSGYSENNGTNFVYADGYTYYWQNTANGFDSEYIWGNYSARKCDDSQLVRIDAKGEKEILYTGNGYGNLGVSDDKVYFQSTDGVYAYNYVTGEKQYMCAGTIIYGDDSSGFLICADAYGTYSVNMATGDVYDVNDRYVSAMEYSNGIVYYYESSNSSSLDIYAGSLDGVTSERLASYTMDSIYGPGASNSSQYSMCGITVSNMQVVDNYLYYCVGARGGTGSIWQGGNLYRMTLDTHMVEQLVTDNSVDADFRVAFGNDGDPVREKLYYRGGSYFDTDYVMNLDTRESEPVNIKAKNTNELFVDGLNLSIYRGTQDELVTLVTGEDYDTHGASRLGSYEKILLSMWDCQVCGDYIYYALWYSTEYDPISIGWRTGYKRETTTIYRKNINTGEVTVVHAF